jgi:hypothetical protein
MNTEAAKEPQTTHRGALNLIPCERGQSGNPGGRTMEFAVGLRRRHNAFWPLRSISESPFCTRYRGFESTLSASQSVSLTKFRSCMRIGPAFAGSMYVDGTREGRAAAPF